MTDTTITLYNLFMVICFCFISFQLGRVYEINREIKKNRLKMEEQDQFYGSRR